MKREDFPALPSMPAALPSYPRGPYRFIDRNYLIITYETDADVLHDALPEPLEPGGSNTALFEFIRMPDSAGFGDYTESGVVIPALLGGELAGLCSDGDHQVDHLQKCGRRCRARQQDDACRCTS
jgi:acetoacetate decarboxylase